MSYIPDWATHYTIWRQSQHTLIINFWDQESCIQSARDATEIAKLAHDLAIADVCQQIKDKPLSERIAEAVRPSADDQPGGSTPSQYGLPEGASDLQDLIEHRGMNFSLGNIFKACYRNGLCTHSDALRDLRKIVWFANREIKRLSK